MVCRYVSPPHGAVHSMWSQQSQQSRSAAPEALHTQGPRVVLVHGPARRQWPKGRSIMMLVSGPSGRRATLGMCVSRLVGTLASADTSRESKEISCSATARPLWTVEEPQQGRTDVTRNKRGQRSGRERQSSHTNERRRSPGFTVTLIALVPPPPRHRYPDPHRDTRF